MKEAYYTDHLKLRLEIRKIPKDYPLMIYQDPERRFFDNIGKTKIAIKRLKYNKKLRNMMIAYEGKDDKDEIITIHPISNEKIMNRILSGRWTENE